MSFIARRIDVKFQLGQGAFGDGASDTVELKGLRAQADIVQDGGLSMAKLDLRIYGMTLDQMNKLTQLQTVLPTDVRKNSVSVFAGDSTGTSLAFTGTLAQSWADMRAMPDVVFWGNAFTGMVDAVKPVDPSSYKGPVSVPFLMAQIASKMTPPRTFENSGVNTVLQNPYLPGTLRDQIIAIVNAARINVLDDGATLAIWPEGSTRGSQSIKISAETGMVGYPAYTENGIVLTTLFNPALQFGTQIEIESELTPASGKWKVYSLAHNLDSQVPGGEWFTRASCNLIGKETPIV